MLTPRFGESEAVAIHPWDVDLLITAPEAWLAQVDLVLQSFTAANRRATRLGCWQRASRRCLCRHASRHLWPRAWELRTNLSTYDALYVAQAEQLGATLLTADVRAARAPGLQCPVEVIAP